MEDMETRKLTPCCESLGGVDRALGELDRGEEGAVPGVGRGDSLVDYSQLLCCGGCVAPYSVAIVPCLGVSDPALLPGPRGRGEEGRLPKCRLWTLQGLSFHCMTWGFGNRDGLGQGNRLAAAISVLISLGLLFPPLGWYVEKATDFSHTTLL